MASTEDYVRQLLALQPRGAAWPRDPESRWMQLLRGLAAGFARIDDRLNDLDRESRPGEALETLDQWEADYGLPDDCTGAPDNIAERQAAVRAKVMATGGQSVAAFKELAASLGYVIDIREFTSFDAGSYAGEPLNGDDWRYTWQIDVVELLNDVNSAFSIFAEFRAGDDAGSYLLGYGSLDLECVIGRAAQAHLVTLFSYPQPPDPILYFDFTKGL